MISPVKSIGAFLSGVSTVALITGCAVIDSEYGVQRQRSQLGVSLQEISGALTMRLCGDKFIVGTMGRSQGFAVVDTSSGTVTAFRALDVYPGPIACGPDGKAAVFLHTAEGAKIGLLDPRTGLLSLSAWRGDNYLMSFVTTNDGLYVGNGYDPGIDTVVIDSNGIRVGEEVNPAVPVIDFTTSTHGTFALTANRRQLFFKPPQEGAGFQELPEILGTLPLGSEVSSLVASGDRVFAIMNKGFDSSSVVVIDARTRERAGTIPLHFSQARSAGVIGRKWYLVGPGHPQWNDGGRKHGGVEVIDLDAADTSVVLVSAEQLGYDVRDYIPLSEHDGYAMCLRPSQSTFLTRIMGARP